MYRLYNEYKERVKVCKKTLRKRQKMNSELRDKYGNPFKREDYNLNKSDISNWNSMIRDLETDMKEMEMYLEFEDRHFLHKEYNDTKSMIYNPNSNEGEIPFSDVHGEIEPDIAEMVCNIAVQDEVVGMLDELLTERQVKITKMYFWDGFTQADIAKELNVSRSAINQNMAIIIANLKKNVKNEGFLKKFID